MTKYLCILAIALSGCATGVHHIERVPTYVNGKVQLCNSNSCYAEEETTKVFDACMAKGNVISRCLKKVD